MSKFTSADQCGQNPRRMGGGGGGRGKGEGVEGGGRE